MIKVRKKNTAVTSEQLIVASIVEFNKEKCHNFEEEDDVK